LGKDPQALGEKAHGVVRSPVKSRKVPRKQVGTFLAERLLDLIGVFKTPADF
jgi:hypothetical protein